MNQILFEIYSFYKLCVSNMHSLFGITFVLFLLKLSAGKGQLTMLRLYATFKPKFGAFVHFSVFASRQFPLSC